MAFLTEDRKDTGCFLMLDCLENIQTALITRSHVRAGFIDQKTVTRLAEEIAAKLRVKTPNLEEKVENLSGGNQQKLLIARWLLTKPRILILDEPTRGIDVGAKSEIHRLMGEMVSRGLSIIMISSELPEVLAMSDRILVIAEGRITATLTRDQATAETVGLAMTARKRTTA